MKKHFLYFLSFLLLNVSYAQEENLQISLEEAVNYAIENNRVAKNAALDIEAAKKQKWETTAIGLPQLNAKIDYQNWLKQQFDGVDFNQDGVIDFGAKQSINATATLSQMLFDGSYLVGLQSAKVFLEISKNAKEKTDLEIRKATINAYSNVLLAEESLNIYNNNIDVLTKNLNETQEIFNNGLTEEESVEQLQITLKQLENGRNNAIRLKDIAYEMLNITLGTNLNTNVKLTNNLEDLAMKHTDLAILSSNNNVEDNIDYKIAANDKKSKELLLKLERSRALPTLNAFVNGSYIGNSNDFDFLDREKQWIGTSLFGVSLNVPIFSSGQSGARKQRAKINLEKAENNLTETEQKLKFQIDSAKSNYQFAIEKHNTSKENLALAERIEKKNQTKYFEGIATSFELRQAQQQLYSSQQEYLQAMLDVITNKVELETILNQTK
ncbi:TolC family protein [Pseudofulvibacter geojedonensis]|uniref:TolC family protein n=1 Tax=Pseudofulvibacter geojedonensis TaxID=1123758 RepID=A0ABW3I650_9FLAO